MTYTAKYKLPGQLFWRSVRKVEGDAIIPETNSHRVLLLANKMRVEIPLTASFKFSKERFYVVKANMEQETGQNIKVKDAG